MMGLQCSVHECFQPMSSHVSLYIAIFVLRCRRSLRLSPASINWPVVSRTSNPVASHAPLLWFYRPASTRHHNKSVLSRSCGAMQTNSCNSKKSDLKHRWAALEEKNNFIKQNRPQWWGSFSDKNRFGRTSLWYLTFIWFEVVHLILFPQLGMFIVALYLKSISKLQENSCYLKLTLPVCNNYTCFQRWISIYRQLRAKRALMLFNDVLLRTRRALSP